MASTHRSSGATTPVPHLASVWDTNTLMLSGLRYPPSKDFDHTSKINDHLFLLYGPLGTAIGIYSGSVTVPVTYSGCVISLSDISLSAPTSSRVRPLLRPCCDRLFAGLRPCWDQLSISLRNYLRPAGLSFSTPVSPDFFLGTFNFRTGTLPLLLPFR